MGIFSKLVSKLTGNTPPDPVATHTRSRLGDGITVAITGPTGPAAHVSSAEITERVREHAFVLDTAPAALKTADEWWNEDADKRRRRDGYEKAFAWILPFLPLEIAKLEQLQVALKNGPHGASAIAKELRALIRARRKTKEPHQELLLALYGACVVKDLSESMRFEGTQPHYMVRFIDINELQQVKIDYRTMGYQCVESLSKTDIKWLVEAFGVPAEHQSFESLWPHIRKNAVARYCWGELQSKNEACKSLGLPQQSMQEWLNELVERNIGYYKEWQARVASRQAYLAEVGAAADAAWAATRQPFVVADLETTGLNVETDEVLEFAAVQVDPDGEITEELSVLVRVSARVPTEITQLTGIKQEDVDREGRPLSEAIKAFATFVGTRPVFFHNAPFDQSFIKKASSLGKVKFSNPVHDTLPLSRKTWPSLGTYKLAALAEHVGAAAPTHRGLADAKATLAVLLAARNKVG